MPGEEAPIEMLELQGITKKFGIYRAVDHVSFRVKAGEVLGYLGPNGAGKSTTIKMLAGLLDPTEGKILFDEQDIRSDPIPRACGRKS
jgi:ABC-2 type transport system ATP-binding protein